MPTRHDAAVDGKTTYNFIQFLQPTQLQVKEGMVPSGEKNITSSRHILGHGVGPMWGP
jgi:hypothetical protein